MRAYQVEPREIPTYTGPDSVKRAAQGRTVDLSGWDESFEGVETYLEWPAHMRRRFRPLKHPRDGHILTDDEIDVLLRGISMGFQASRFGSTEEFLDFIMMREQVREKVYGMYESDISVCRFFSDGAGEKQENILSDIKRMNEEQGMGNIRIPGTDVEIINYSPCPKCGHVHSYSDVFSYYMNPVPDPKFKNRKEQHATDTRVKCVECGDFFLPALIIADGSPRVEHQMICRMQTVREVGVYMRASFQLDVLMYRKDNIMEKLENGKSWRSWRNDVNIANLKQRPGLLTNFLQYTPAPLMLDFISGRNLEIPQPLYGAWKNPAEVNYYDLG